MKKIVTFSIVSHNQSAMIEQLCNDLSNFGSYINLIIKINSGFCPNIDNDSFNSIKFIYNKSPLGFGHNHNNAFLYCFTEVFVICNPDIRISKSNLFLLLFKYNKLSESSVWGPLLIEHGKPAENGRNFPTCTGMVLRFLKLNSESLYQPNSGTVKVDWIGGMFMVFSRTNFSLISGFDQNKFFMYLEDVDICKRLSLNGILVAINTEITVNHDAQRGSRKNFKHLYWHFTSLLKFLFL
jgi:N-acetylglucosaminyl-diphospho-decaprenol L-rhamnosyltransferase